MYFNKRVQLAYNRVKEWLQVLQSYVKGQVKIILSASMMRNIFGQGCHIQHHISPQFGQVGSTPEASTGSDLLRDHSWHSQWGD